MFNKKFLDKRIIQKIFFSLFVFMMPLLSLAENLIPCTDNCKYEDLMTLINNVINFILLKLAIPIAAICFAYAGFLYIFSAGDTSKRSKATSIFTSVALGLIFVAAAWLIISLILNILGYKGLDMGF